MHYRKIDGLRFVAIFFVLIAHFLFVVERRLPVGWYGVQLFFCISGFLITGILMADSHESIGRRIYNFFGRRFLRIFPIYYLTIAVLYVIGYRPVRQFIGYLLTYTFNFAQATHPMPFSSISHLWSLCVEEQFYLFWPFFIFGLFGLCSLLKVRKYYWPILATGIALLALVSLLQHYFGIFPALAIASSWPGTVTNMFALCIGALGALAQKRRLFVHSKLLTNVALEWAVILFLFVLLYKDSSLKYLLCPFISLFLVLKAANDHYSRPIAAFLSNRTVVWIGTISYGIYLYHLPLSELFMSYFYPFYDGLPWQRLGPKLAKLHWNTWIVAFPLRSGIAITVAHFSFIWLERPLLRLKDIYFSRRPAKSITATNTEANLPNPSTADVFRPLHRPPKPARLRILVYRRANNRSGYLPVRNPIRPPVLSRHHSRQLVAKPRRRTWAPYSQSQRFPYLRHTPLGRSLTPSPMHTPS
jgi:peptidoglycan/LPS O-acetylase OafA/YrhL